MRFLESNQIAEWLDEHSLAFPSADPLIADPGFTHVQHESYASGSRSGREPAVARACLQALGDWTETLVWVRSWGIWPSSENWPQYYEFRGGQGERRSLEKAPGHLLALAEAATLELLMTMVLENAWDAVVIPAPPTLPIMNRLMVSHDEWVEFQSKAPFVRIRIAG